MLDTGILFKLAGMGITMIIIDNVLKSSGKGEIAVVADITGLVIILGVVIKLISGLFVTVKTLFQV